MNKYDINPNQDGYFGAYGGQILPPAITPIFTAIADFYTEIKDTQAFKEELAYYYQHYIGRPSPIFHAKNLSDMIGGAQIYLKREDLNHTGAHKINHCIGEVLIAKKMGKTKVIAETGAGQHGLALATACALFAMPCEIFMGAIDIAKEAPNVEKIKLLGATVVPVTSGTQTLKDAVDAALTSFLQDPEHIFFGIGSVVGPHPFPMIVRDLQRIVGEEAKLQFPAQTGKLPDHVVACVGGGSNALGLFSAFLEDEQIILHGVEPRGKSLDLGQHAATLTLGTPGDIHGMHTYVLQDAEGIPQPVYSIASGLDYPGVGPQHSFLKDSGRVQYETISDQECVEAFYLLSQKEGIIPALESAHALAFAMKLARTLTPEQTILVNLSGRGDKDIDFILAKYPQK